MNVHSDPPGVVLRIQRADLGEDMHRDEFDGRVAWITGGGSGIGRGTALRFAEEGARVVVSDVNLEGAKETVSLVEEAGGSALANECDVRDLAACTEAVACTVAEYGRLDAVFANAGIGVPGNVEFVDESVWSDVIDVNLSGVFRTAKASIPAMRETGGGAIVITSSIEGLVGSQFLSAYCTAKTGVVGLARALADECAKDNIRVNCINPGLIETPMTAPIKMAPDLEAEILGRIPLGRAGQPDDVAGVVLFLCSQDARYVTGQWLAVDGGMTATV